MKLDEYPVLSKQQLLSLIRVNQIMCEQQGTEIHRLKERIFELEEKLKFISYI